MSLLSGSSRRGRCWTAAPYETLHDSQDDAESRSVISKRVWMFGTSLFVLLFVTAMTTATGGRETFPSANISMTTASDTSKTSSDVLLSSSAAASTETPAAAHEKKHHHHGHHTLPTALSLVEPDTGLFVYALDNPLYDRLLERINNRQENDDRQQRNLRASAPSIHLSLDRTTISIRDSLTLSWKDHDNILSDDHVMELHCPPDNTIFTEAATMAQVRATHIHHGGDPEQTSSWYIPEFRILRENSCVFKLYDREGDSVLSESPELTIQDATATPTNIHMAFSNDPQSMVLQFVTGDEGVPVVRYETSKQQLDKTETGTSISYKSDDLCQSPANQAEPGKFLSPGNLHTVTLNNLLLDKDYHYQVGLQTKGDSHIVWSDVHTFRSSLPVGSTIPFSFVVYGDQGCPSKGWGEGARLVSSMTAREVQTSPALRSIHHFGDLSYAQGAGHVWDEWFNIIEPFSTNIPLMVGVGNHEYDHTAGGRNKDPSGVNTDHGYMPAWGNFGEDSGGECGVPTAARFQMPESEGSNGVFWYSHNYGMVHTIVLSSEHDVSKESPQYAWLERDLRNVDRKVTPWVVIETHRPLYESEAAYDQAAVSIALRFELEDLLKQHKVDVVLGGHYHMYMRTCDGLYRSECNQGGPIHITVGSAGANLDTAPMIPQPWAAHVIQQEFGYGRMTVMNATALHFEFVKAGDESDPETGTVRDDVWILRDRN